MSQLNPTVDDVCESIRSIERAQSAIDAALMREQAQRIRDAQREMDELTARDPQLAAGIRFIFEQPWGGWARPDQAEAWFHRRL